MAKLRFPIQESDHVIGPPGAPVTLVEYGDYQCPHCQAAWPQVELVLRHFGRNLRYAYRHFPISTAHPLARPAAECAEFAGAHGLFWEMHSAVYANGHRLSGTNLMAIASQLRLDVAELRNALEHGTYAAKVEDDFLSGVRSGVNGTPCFFVNGERHDGAYAAPALVAAITAAAQAAVPTIEIHSRGRVMAANRERTELLDRVEEADLESFPASDPPAWTLGSDVDEAGVESMGPKKKKSQSPRASVETPSISSGLAAA